MQVSHKHTRIKQDWPFAPLYSACENYKVTMTWTFDRADIPMTRSSGSGTVRCSCALLTFLTPNQKKRILGLVAPQSPRGLPYRLFFCGRLTNDLHPMCLWRHLQGDGVVVSGLSVANVEVSPWWTGVAEWHYCTVFRVFLLNVDQCGKTKNTHCFRLMHTGRSLWLIVATLILDKRLNKRSTTFVKRHCWLLDDDDSTVLKWLR